MAVNRRACISGVLRRLAWLACAALSPAVVHGVSFDYSDVSAEQIPFYAGHLALDAGGAWVVGNALARFGANGSLAFEVPIALLGGDALLATTSDGSAVLAEIPIPLVPFLFPCVVSRVDSGGVPRWTEQISANGYCAALTVDANDTVWVEVASYFGGPSALFQLDADGSGLFQSTLAADFYPLSALVPADAGGVFVAGSFVSGQTVTGSVQRVDASGQIAWQWIDSDASSELAALQRDGSGNIYAAGVSDPNGKSTLTTVSLSPAGDLRWTQHFTSVPATIDLGYAVAADGTAFALDHPRSAGPASVQKFGADGTLVWDKASPLQGAPSTLSLVDGHQALRLAADGDVAAIVDSGGAITATTELLRYDADGNLIATSVLSGQQAATAVRALAIETLADSSVVVTTASNVTAADGSGDVGSAASSGVVLHFDRGGNALGGPFAAFDVSVGGNVIGSVIGADGTTYLLTQYATTQVNQPANDLVGAFNARYAISRIAADGTLVWKTYANGYWYAARLSAATDRVCIGGSLGAYFLGGFNGATPPAGTAPDTRVECRASASGALTWSTQLAPAHGFDIYSVSLATLDASTTFAAYKDFADAANLYAVDTAGHATKTGSASATGADIYAVAADGSVLLVASAAPPVATVVQQDGSIRYARTLSGWQSLLGGAYLDDESAEFAGIAPDGSAAAMLLTPAGSVQWTAQLADAATAGLVQQFAGAVDDHDAYFALATASTTRFVGLDRDGGAVRWSSSADPAGGTLGLAVDPHTADVVAYDLDTYRFGVRTVAHASGAVGAIDYRPCGNAGCASARIAGAGIDTAGTFRVVFTNQDFAGSTSVPASQLLAIDAVANPPVAIPAGQPGIVGAWYAPYESGQGFVIDYIAASNQVFIPWFTYTQQGGNDPAALAWYTFQGTAAAGATEVDLAIGATDGGVFGSGIVTAQQVGTAHLAFTDCDHGTLNYQFDDGVNGAAAGTMTIVRLGPSTSACRLSGNATRPAEDAAPPANGFDARQSGSWYDPATSGQGIEFVVVPAGSGTPGLFFGAWFTFDPAGTADDPAQQHWFTLQGDLSSATNGRVSVPIVATIGGVLDYAPTSDSVAAGQATVTFSGCASAVLDYQFSDAAIAHAYRNVSGSVHLVRIGGCGG